MGRRSTAKCSVEDQVHSVCRVGDKYAEILTKSYRPSCRASDGETFRARTTIALNVSNVVTHPGKTLYGCSYKMELLDKNGNQL
jgi:hypothetical protein